MCKEDEIQKSQGNHVMRSLLIICALCLVVVACGGDEGTKGTTDLATPTYTLQPTKTPTSEPTPTETPEPGPEEISWGEARANIGATAKVCGEVVTVMILLDNRTVVNLGDIPSEGGVIVVITDSTMFPEGVIRDQYGEDICVTGEIVQEESDAGTYVKVGIYVTDPAQIEIDE